MNNPSSNCAPFTVREMLKNHKFVNKRNRQMTKGKQEPKSNTTCYFME